MWMQNETHPTNVRCASWERQLTAGTPDAIRTHDLQSRSLTLYPAELRAHKIESFYIITQKNKNAKVFCQFFMFDFRKIPKCFCFLFQLFTYIKPWFPLKSKKL